MLAHKLVDLIERNSRALAHSLLTTFRNDSKMADLHRVPAQELETRAFEVYRNLNDWLTTRTEADIERLYTEIGRRRARQGVSLSHLQWALVDVKRHLWEFLDRETNADQMLELKREIELIRSVDRFFDLTLYYVARGYEKEQELQAAVQAHTVSL